MKKKFELEDEFDNEELNHFTHYDYLLQTIDNGQRGALKEALKAISNKSLIHFLKIMPKWDSFADIVICEMLERMDK